MGIVVHNCYTPASTGEPLTGNETDWTWGLEHVTELQLLPWAALRPDGTVLRPLDLSKQHLVVVAKTSFSIAILRWERKVLLCRQFYPLLAKSIPEGDTGILFWPPPPPRLLFIGALQGSVFSMLESTLTNWKVWKHGKGRQVTKLLSASKTWANYALSALPLYPFVFSSMFFNSAMKSPGVGGNPDIWRKAFSADSPTLFSCLSETGNFPELIQPGISSGVDEGK